MKNKLSIVFFLFLLIISCLCTEKRLQRVLKFKKGRCFEFQLQKRKLSIEKTLNLINLFSSHRVRNAHQSSFLSYHLKNEGPSSIISQTSKIQAVDQKGNVSVYLTNKHNAQVSLDFHFLILIFNWESFWVKLPSELNLKLSR